MYLLFIFLVIVTKFKIVKMTVYDPEFKGQTLLMHNCAADLKKRIFPVYQTR